MVLSPTIAGTRRPTVLAGASTTQQGVNQIARNLDVMMEPSDGSPEPLSERDPERSIFLLVTPQLFMDHPTSRLYGWLMNTIEATGGPWGAGSRPSVCRARRTRGSNRLDQLGDDQQCLATCLGLAGSRRLTWRTEAKSSTTSARRVVTSI
jgi:hypothetical protein